MIRADMTYAELPGGGAIFAVGSITFCGSLSHNHYDNNVSRILRNVIERFRALR
jgi:N,N-dimethylformamidase